VKQQVVDLFQQTFGAAPTVVARAPGRIEFIGNHTDYNGGPVIGASIDKAVWVAARPLEGTRARFMSPIRVGIVETDITQPERRTGPQSWINYPLGVFLALRARGAAPSAGFEFAASSDLPSGSGLSSSAALELATAHALAQLAGKSLPPKEMALLSQEAENKFVGVPCGVLDQGVSAHGRENHLVFIDCAALEFRTVPLPAGTRFWIFNTHKKHSLVDSMYAQRHGECRMAFAAIHAAFPAVSCLAEASIAQLESVAASLAAEVVRRARHVIEETGRVHQVVAALAKGDIATVGKAMIASHRSSQHLFENSVPELDHLVDVLEKTPHVIGARLTGGGFGGAVVALTEDAFSETEAETVTAAYEAKFGARPNVLRCQTSEGAGVV
jgi:galactokinase